MTSHEDNNSWPAFVIDKCLLAPSRTKVNSLLCSKFPASLLPIKVPSNLLSQE